MKAFLGNCLSFIQTILRAFSCWVGEVHQRFFPSNLHGQLQLWARCRCCVLLSEHSVTVQPWLSNPLPFASPEALGCCPVPGVSNTGFPCQPHKSIWQRCFHTAPKAVWKGTKQFWGSVVGLGAYCVWSCALLAFGVQDCSGNSVPNSRM